MIKPSIGQGFGNGQSAIIKFWHARAVVFVTISNTSCLNIGPLGTGLKIPTNPIKSYRTYFIIPNIPN